MRMRLGAGVLFLCSAILFTNCTRSSTSVVAPTANKCNVSATNATGSFASNGGSGTVSVSASRDCTWSVSSDASWIGVQGPNSGQGDASIGYTVQANPTPAVRSGAIVVSSSRLDVSQAGAPCRYTLSRTGDSIDATGGTLSVDVATLTGCSWSTTSGVAWITIRSGQSGTASGTVALAIAANDGTTRVGSVNVAGQNYTVTQAAVASSPAPAPSPPPTPTPQPVPKPTVKDFSGDVAKLSGACPSIAFHVGGVSVEANSATLYNGGGCRNVRNGTQVSGSGVVQEDGAVLATSITFNKD